MLVQGLREGQRGFDSKEAGFILKTLGCDSVDSPCAQLSFAFVTFNKLAFINTSERWSPKWAHFEVFEK